MRIHVAFQEANAQFFLGFEDESSFALGFHESFTKSTNAQYAGSYEVTPKILEQSLPTQDRWLSRDVIVRAIPYYEVGNSECGNTAIIGG